MNEFEKTNFSERLKTAAEAKQALLAKLKPKATVIDPQFAERAAERAAQKAAELEKVRQDRVDAKLAKKQAVIDAEEAVKASAEAIEAAALDAKRGERKERKALTKSEAKAKRDARYAARKSRQ